MKNKYVTAIAAILLLLPFFMSCDGEDYNDGGIIIPCDNQEKVVERIKNRKIELRGVYPNPMGDYAGVLANHGLAYYTKTENAYIYTENDGFYCKICNFPDYAKQWIDFSNRDEGIDVMFSGVLYENPSYRIDDDIKYVLELTSLKKK